MLVYANESYQVVWCVIFNFANNTHDSDGILLRSFQTFCFIISGKREFVSVCEIVM